MFAYYLKLYFTSLLVFLLIDSIWLGFVARDLYRSQIGFILKDKFNLIAGLIFYLIFIVGLVFFVINPAESWEYALFAGMFFGFISYATYDMTNLATIKNWPLLLTIIDIIWGSLLCGMTSLISYLLFNIM